jgi:hypothetical protein
MQAHSVEFRMILMQETFHSVVSMLVNSNSCHLQVSRKPHVQLSTFSNQQSLTLPLQWENEGRCFFSIGDLHVDPAGKQVSLEFGNEHKHLGAHNILCVSYPSRSSWSLAPCRVLKTNCCLPLDDVYLMTDTLQFCTQKLSHHQEYLYSNWTWDLCRVHLQGIKWLKRNQSQL